MARRYWLSAVAGAGVVLVIAGFNLFFRLGAGHVGNWDEATHGVLAHEMLESGDWLVTTYAGQPDVRFRKPPLGIWMIALSYATFGYTPLALRLPAAISALLGVAAVMALARHWFGARVALGAGLILATCLPYVAQHAGRSGDLEAPLTLVMIVGMACVPGFARRPGRALGLGLCVAVAFLLKGFAAVQLVAVAGVFLVLSGDARVVPAGRWLAVSAAAAAPTALWALLRHGRDGTGFLGRLLGQEVFLRMGTLYEAPPSHPLYYAGWLLDRMAPWPELALLAAGWLALRAWRGQIPPSALRPSGPVLLLVVWALVPLLLFSASTTRYHWYINPTLPALAMLAALAVRTLVTTLPGSWRYLVGAVAVLGLALGQARVTQHILVKSPMREPQRALLALGALGRGTVLHAARPWHLDERFLLQVVNGLRLREPGTPCSPPCLTLLDHPPDTTTDHPVLLAPPYAVIERSPQ